MSTDDYFQRKLDQSVLELAREVLARQEALIENRHTKKFKCPVNPMEQAWLLREFLKGPGKVVSQCERTRQVDPDNISSPVLVCAPDNTDTPCWNCMIQVLTGKKKWY